MRNGLSESEAGKLGAIATKKVHAARKLKAIQIYTKKLPKKQVLLLMNCIVIFLKIKKLI